MKELIPEYLKAHESAWAPSTMKSERSRLKSLTPHLESPEKLMEHLTAIEARPYAIKTAFIRVTCLESWAKLEPRFRAYMEKHERRFRYLYEKEELQITYLDAWERLKTLPDPSRSMAEALLTTGCRLSEAYTFCNGRVTGKGGKIRKIYGTIKETAPKSTFARHLKAVGLKPHTLRKLCATRLAEKGASPADLCKVFGWRDIATAYQYLQAKDESKLEAFMATK